MKRARGRNIDLAKLLCGCMLLCAVVEAAICIELFYGWDWLHATYRAPTRYVVWVLAIVYAVGSIAIDLLTIAQTHSDLGKQP